MHYTKKQQYLKKTHKKPKNPTFRDFLVFLKTIKKTKALKNHLFHP